MDVTEAQESDFGTERRIKYCQRWTDKSQLTNAIQLLA